MIFIEHRRTRMPHETSPMTAAPFPHPDASPCAGQTRLSRESLLAANVDPDTGLATDYLNHFNEMVMALDLLADMPDLLEDVLAWAPISYRAHFERSGFSSRAIVIAAYDVAPAAIRAAFDATIAAIDARLTAAQRALATASESEIAWIAPARSGEVRPLLAQADRLIHGASSAAAVEAIQA